MGQLTPTFLFGVERRMRIIGAQEYERLTASLIWSQIAKEMQSDGKSERLIWLMDTAQIQYQDRNGGMIEFADMVANTQEFTSLGATSGFRVNRWELDDVNGGGVEAAVAWARQIGIYAAYWPQKQVLNAIKVGGAASSKTYDLQPFFSTAHPLNPFDSSLGNYANDFTGAASGAYPGALPIDESVSIDVAFLNLKKAIQYVRSIPMPNGEDPRKLRVKALMVPPALEVRAGLLTDAKFIAGAVGGLAGVAGGSTDIAAVISKWGLGQPIVVDEFAAGFANGSDTTYYLLIEQAAGDQQGALIYVNREPFEVVYNNGMTSADLQRANTLQWTTRGRNVVGYGHPYLLFRCQST